MSVSQPVCLSVTGPLSGAQINHTVKVDVQTVAIRNTVEERYSSSHGGRESGLFPGIISLVLLL